MRHFIRSHERNRRHSLKTADEQRRSSLTNSNDSHLFRKSSLPARAFANNSTTSNVNGAGRRFRRFNTISDDINPVTLSLVVCSIAFFIVAALFYSLYWRKWTAEPFLTIVLRPWWNCLGTRTGNITEQLWWRIPLTQWQGQGKGNWHHPEVTFGSKVHCFLNYPASSAPVLPVCSTFVYCSSYGDVA